MKPQNPVKTLQPYSRTTGSVRTQLSSLSINIWFLVVVIKARDEMKLEEDEEWKPVLAGSHSI